MSIKIAKTWLITLTLVAIVGICVYLGKFWQISGGAVPAPLLPDSVAAPQPDQQERAARSPALAPIAELPSSSERSTVATEAYSSLAALDSEDESLNEHSDAATETHFLWVKSIALPGSSAVQKRAFEIPSGWSLQSTKLLKHSGRARILTDDNFVVLEVHAIAPNNLARQEAYANAEIVIAKIEDP